MTIMLVGSTLFQKGGPNIIRPSCHAPAGVREKIGPGDHELFAAAASVLLLWDCRFRGLWPPGRTVGGVAEVEGDDAS